MIYNTEAVSVIREITIVSHELKYDASQLVDLVLNKQMLLDTNGCEDWLEIIKDDIEKLEQACNALKELKQSTSNVRKHISPYEYFNVE